MIRFLITYDAPPDPTAFDRHYREVHQPLTARLPGILSYTVQPAPRAVRGVGYHQVVEITWADWDAVEQAFASPQGHAAAADVANLDAPTRSCLYEVPESPAAERGDRRADLASICGTRTAMSTSGCSAPLSGSSRLCPPDGR